MSEKKKRDRQINKRFNSLDIDRWQSMANSVSGGNLTLYMESAADEYYNKMLKSINPLRKNCKKK